MAGRAASRPCQSRSVPAPQALTEPRPEMTMEGSVSEVKVSSFLSQSAPDHLVEAVH
jgi:hypothetical protein